MNKLKLLNITFTDSPLRWQTNFQDPATPIMEGIINLHHEIMGYLIFILIFVVYMLARTVYLFPEGNLSVGQLPHSVTLETIWTILPFFILIAIAMPSFALLYSLDEAPRPHVTIHITGRQWYWTYEYPTKDQTLAFDSYMLSKEDLNEGQHRLLEVDNRLVLPTGMPIRLLITGGDVIHSWAVPSLGIKMDAIPGRINQVFVYIKREGVFYGQCSELCGVNHGFMPIVVEALSPTHFSTWYNTKYFQEVEAFPEDAVQLSSRLSHLLGYIGLPEDHYLRDIKFTPQADRGSPAKEWPTERIFDALIDFARQGLGGIVGVCLGHLIEIVKVGILYPEVGLSVHNPKPFLTSMDPATWQRLQNVMTMTKINIDVHVLHEGLHEGIDQIQYRTGYFKEKTIQKAIIHSEVASHFHWKLNNRPWFRVPLYASPVNEYLKEHILDVLTPSQEGDPVRTINLDTGKVTTGQVVKFRLFR